MASPQKAIVMAFRGSAADRAILQEVADAREVPVASLLYDLVMPRVRKDWLKIQAGKPVAELPATSPEVSTRDVA